MMPASEDDHAVGRELRRQATELRLQLIAAMRESLLAARSDGTYSSATLEDMLRILDADQITTELRA
jgi:CPA1 family monovalent cation:H+ antiporter